MMWKVDNKGKLQDFVFSSLGIKGESDAFRSSTWIKFIFD